MQHSSKRIRSAPQKQCNENVKEKRARSAPTKGACILLLDGDHVNSCSFCYRLQKTTCKTCSGCGGGCLWHRRYMHIASLQRSFELLFTYRPSNTDGVYISTFAYFAHYVLHFWLVCVLVLLCWCYCFLCDSFDCCVCLFCFTMYLIFC